jgi:P4 family phage/plasmid primase-like protien
MTSTAEPSSKKIQSMAPSPVVTFDKLLEKKVIEKGSSLELTHQQFGKYTKRSYSITDSNEYEEFMKMYYNEVLKVNRTHNIIERQLTHKQKGPGVHLIDIDLQFSQDYVTRQYTQSHVDGLLDFILCEYETIFELDEDIQFPLVIMEKPSPRVVTKNSGTIVKDGIHIMSCVKIDPYLLLYLRDKMIKFLEEKWSDLPITNTWEDVVDKSIADGTNGWLLPNSKKEDEPTYYSITKAYRVYFDSDTEKFDKNPLVEKPADLKPFYSQYYKQLFIRNEKILSLELLTDLGSEAVEKYQTKRKSNVDSGTKMLNGGGGDMFGFGGDENWQISSDVVRQLTTKEDAMTLLNGFLDSLPSDKLHLKTIYQYTDILPETYYGPGSYNKWIRVGLALHHTSRYLLIVWLIFSAKSKQFNWTTDVEGLLNHWSIWSNTNTNTNPNERLTVQSLMYWCKTDAYDEYIKVRDESIVHMIDQSYYGLSIQQLNSRGKHKGSTDNDIAKVLYALYQGAFVASSIKGNEWWKIEKHYWEKDDCGTSLRKKISTELRNLYYNKAIEKMKKAMTIRTADGSTDEKNEEHQLLRAQSNYLREISDRLGNTKEKDNIMREAREIFFNKEFVQKLDAHRHLLCFNNGVIDFNTQEFRPGKPDDYISKCTKTDYVPLDKEKFKTAMKEIETYMHQLFPKPELYDYMWIHFASLLTGFTDITQCLHYYIGVGSNGKSLLINLLELILGDYAVGLDSSFYTCAKGGRGSATPDLAKLPGARLAITQEPTEAGKPLCLIEGPMKQLTSGADKIVFRGLYKEEESFIPQAHGIMCANDFLPVKSRDDGTWRRFRVIPFLSVFTDNPTDNDPEKPYQYHIDSNIKNKFQEWLPVITGMLVEIAFQYKGHVPMCNIVKKESAAYRTREDYISAFIDEFLEKCEPNPHERLQKSIVQRLFTDWYQKEYGEKSSNKLQKVYEVMNKRFGEIKKSPTSGWDGVRQKKMYADEPATTDEDADEEE